MSDTDPFLLMRVDALQSQIERLNEARGIIPGVEHRTCLLLIDGPPGTTLCSVLGDELARAERHGKTFASLHEAYAVMFEELNEVWDIAKQKRKDRKPEELRKELIQCAAMAIKAIRSMENFVGGDV